MALLRMCIRPGTLRFIDIVGDPDLHRFFQQLRRFTIARIASDQLPDVIFVRMPAFPVGQGLLRRGRQRGPWKRTASYCRLLPGQQLLQIFSHLTLILEDPPGMALMISPAVDGQRGVCGCHRQSAEFMRDPHPQMKPGDFGHKPERTLAGNPIVGTIGAPAALIKGRFWRRQFCSAS